MRDGGSCSRGPLGLLASSQSARAVCMHVCVSRHLVAAAADGLANQRLVAERWDEGGGSEGGGPLCVGVRVHVCVLLVYRRVWILTMD